MAIRGIFTPHKILWGYSIVAIRGIRIAEPWVRFPVSPQILRGAHCGNASSILAESTLNFNCNIMNTISRTITGIAAIILGSYLIICAEEKIIVFIYGIPIFIIGIFILFNKKEDDIEKIKKNKK